jgi:hypothetical protein
MYKFPTIMFRTLAKYNSTSHFFFWKILILLDSKFVALGKQQTFRHKIKIFRKNGRPCDIVSENLKYGQNRQNIVLHSFYKPFCRTCLLYSTPRCARRAVL